MKRLLYNRRSFVIAIILGVLVAGCTWYYLNFCPWKTSFQLTGLVIDRETKRPVPNARLVVTLVDRRLFNEGYFGYGVTADENGRFTVDIPQTTRGFNDAFVEASAPNNNYAVEDVTDGKISLLTGPSAIQPQQRNLQYQNFRGSAVLGRPSSPLVFLGEGWPIAN